MHILNNFSIPIITLSSYGLSFVLETPNKYQILLSSWQFLLSKLDSFAGKLLP